MESSLAHQKRSSSELVGAARRKRKKPLEPVQLVSVSVQVEQDPKTVYPCYTFYDNTDDSRITDVTVEVVDTPPSSPPRLIIDENWLDISDKTSETVSPQLLSPKTDLPDCGISSRDKLNLLKAIAAVELNYDPCSNTPGVSDDEEEEPPRRTREAAAGSNRGLKNPLDGLHPGASKGPMMYVRQAYGSAPPVSRMASSVSNGSSSSRGSGGPIKSDLGGDPAPISALEAAQQVLDARFGGYRPPQQSFISPDPRPEDRLPPVTSVSENTRSDFSNGLDMARDARAAWTASTTSFSGFRLPTPPTMTPPQMMMAYPTTSFMSPGYSPQMMMGYPAPGFYSSSYPSQMMFAVPVSASLSSSTPPTSVGFQTPALTESPGLMGFATPDILRMCAPNFPAPSPILAPPASPGSASSPEFPASFALAVRKVEENPAPLLNLDYRNPACPTLQNENTGGGICFCLLCQGFRQHMYTNLVERYRGISTSYNWPCLCGNVGCQEFWNNVPTIFRPG